MPAKAIFFDAANTLVYKPGLYPALSSALEARGIDIPRVELTRAHRMLSEVLVFPDRTSREFYLEFNSHLLRAFGILPYDDLLDDIYQACSYLPWAAFPDTKHIARLDLPLGIISNWNASLTDELAIFTDVEFRWVLGSEEHRLRKPDPAFFTRALDASGYSAGEVVYVGDSLKLDIEPALHLGMRPILIDRDDLFPHANVPRIKSLGSLERLL